jgi:hypothetical protein
MVQCWRRFRDSVAMFNFAVGSTMPSGSVIRTVPFHKPLRTFCANMLANSSDHDLVVFIVHLEFLGATTPGPPNPFILILGPQEPREIAVTEVPVYHCSSILLFFVVGAVNIHWIHSLWQRRSSYFYDDLNGLKH